MQGTVKVIERFREKWFGFVTPSEGGQDVFFHFSGCAGGIDAYNDLHEGDVIEYEIQTGRDGKPKAINIAVSE